MLIKKDWSILQVLRQTWRFDLWIIVVCAFSNLLYEYLINQHIQIPAQVSTVIGTALAFFIGFNNNQAYDRWWEARKIWGALVNDSRSWCRSILAYVGGGEPGQEADKVKGAKIRMIHRHLAFLNILKDSLRKIPDPSYAYYLSDQEHASVRGSSNIPNSLLTLQAYDLQELSQNNKVDGFRFLELDQLLVKFCDHMGKCERIKNTVFPTSYYYFTRLSIWIFIVLNTLVLTDLIGGWSILIGWLIGFIFFAAHHNGTNIMNPFENRAFDTPMSAIVRTIEINILEELGEPNLPEPIKPTDDYLM